jgi:AAA15 family ATPase/GTPase
MRNKIGIKNFRVFEEMKVFEIRPLTLLTGPNNSGKS